MVIFCKMYVTFYRRVIKYFGMYCTSTDDIIYDLPSILKTFYNSYI